MRRIYSLWKRYLLPETNYFPKNKAGRTALREAMWVVNHSVKGSFLWLLLLLGLAAGVYGWWLIVHGAKGPGWVIANIVWVDGLLVLWYWCKLMRGVMRRRLFEMGICPTCGYDLTANVSGTCPECGLNLPSCDHPTATVSEHVAQVSTGSIIHDEPFMGLVCAGVIFLAVAALLHWMSGNMLLMVGSRKSSFLGLMTLHAILMWCLASVAMLTGFALGIASRRSAAIHYLSRLAIRIGVYLGAAGFVVFMISMIAFGSV